MTFDLPLVGINREHGKTLTLVGAQGAIAELVSIARGTDDGDDFRHWTIVAGSEPCRDPGSVIRDPGSGIRKIASSRIPHRAPRIPDPGPRIPIVQWRY